MKTALVESVAAKYSLLDANMTPKYVKANVVLALKNLNCAFWTYTAGEETVCFNFTFPP